MLISKSRAWYEVDRSAIKHNVEAIRALLHGNTKIMAVVKANAYGTGDLEVSKCMQECGVDFFAVSSVDEALSLRKNGIQESLLILGYTPPEHFHYLSEYQIIQTLVSLDYAKKLDAYCEQAGVKIRAHVKVDTGMSRIGIRCVKQDDHIADVLEAYRLPHLQVEGMFSHFAVSDNIDQQEHIDFTNEQIAQFEYVRKKITEAGIKPGIVHLQNSYGIINYPELSYDYVRPGILLLGFTSDCKDRLTQPIDLKPAVSLKANVTLVKTVQPGSCVSYGRNYRPKEQRRIATVCLGYADGYPRFVSNRGSHVLIHGEKAPIVGNICMDQMMVDITDLTCDVQEGDVVTFFGEDHGAYLAMDELSHLAQTINNETLCWIGARVPRIYK